MKKKAKESTDSLFLLIKSMTKAEKIYFRKQSSAFAGKDGSAYLELFDAMAAQKQYDEAALRKELDGKRFLKQLSVIKNYLYENILDALVRFRAKEDSEIQLYQAKQTIVVLIEKKMLQPALKILKKAMQNAVAEERFLAVINFLTLKHRLLVNLQSENISSQQETWQEIDQYLHKFANLQSYQRLHASVLYWLRKDRHARSPETAMELDKLLSAPPLQQIEHAESFWAKMFFFSTHDAYYKAQGDFKKSLEYAQASLQLYEEAPRMQKNDPQNYLGVIVNHLNAAYYTQNTALLWQGIQLLQTINFKDYKLQNLRFIRYTVFYFSYMKLTNNFLNFNVLCKETLAYFDQHQQISNNEKRLVFYNILHNCVRIGDYQQALDWRLRLGEIPKTNTQSDFQRFERLLEILIHLALGNEELVLALCQHATRHFQTTALGYESTFVVLFRDLVKTPSYERKAVLESYSQLFEQLFEQQPSEKKALEYFDILLWIRAYAQNVSMSKLLDNG